MSFTRQPKSNNKVGVGCLVIALLLVAVLFGGVYSASALKSTINIANDEEKIELTGWVDPEKLYSYIDLPDFGPDVLEGMKDPTIVASYGKVPKFVDDEGRWNWLEKLDGLRRRIRNEMRPYLHPESVVIAYGYNINGFFFVEFLEGSSVNKTLMDEMYGVIDKEAKEIGIENVPIIFRIGSLPELESGRDDRYRPIIGGVQIQQDETYTSTTLGFSTKKTDGSDYGYVVAGHLGEGATSVGMGIYQPTYPDYPAGTVAETGGTYADASWVPYGYVAPKIYISDSSIEGVDFYTDPVVGMGVYKSGITTDLTYGTVVEIYDSSHPSHGTLYDQAKATYDSASGDSGSPVYTIITGTQRGIVGIHWGRISSSGTGVFSPTSGVQNDLDVVPLTTADKLPPIAHASDISNQPDVMHPDTLYEVTAKYYDPDGRANLELCTLVLSRPSDSIMMGWGEDLKVPVEESEFINDGDLDVDYTPITDSYEGYQLTWKFKLSDTWPEAENCIDFCVLARDDDELQSELDCDNTDASFVVPERTITFYMDPADGGTLTFDGSIYSNGQSTTKTDATYSVSANPASNYAFDHWSITGSVSVANPNSQSTTATVSGDGTIKAWFNYIPPERTITFYMDPADGGTLTVDGSIYSNGQSTTKTDATYSVSANPASNYAFDHWSITGSVSVANSNSQSTTVTVSGDGTIKAWFNYIPPERTITFYTDPTAGGTLTFDGSVYSNGQSTTKTDGTYSVSANPASNYEFDHWSTTGGVSVANPNSQSTTATVSGDGTIKAWFNYLPELFFSPKSHDFGDKCEGETDSTTFELWNSGTGTLTYSLSESCGWVEVNPTSGSSTGEHNTITVDIDTTGLSEGIHTCDITINSNGGNGTFTVTVNIIPSTGSIYVTSEPSGAKIYLDNKYEGKTPHTITEVPPGYHTIKLTLMGYHNWTKRIQVTAGETTYVHATLTPLPICPDLVITGKWLCWPDNCTICYNVTNIGNGTAPACHNTTLYVDGEEVAHDHVPVDLAPGESYTGCLNGYVWTYTPPSDNITVCADNNETLVELDEDNNCLANIWMCGAVRKDGFVTAWDVAVLNSYVAGIGELEIEQKWAGDVRTDGYITAWDVAVLNSKVAGIGAISCMCTQPDL